MNLWKALFLIKIIAIYLDFFFFFFLTKEKKRKRVRNPLWSLSIESELKEASYCGNEVESEDWMVKVNSFMYE
jgi:hypothetical protein